MNFLSFWKTLAIHTKISAVFVVFVFISIPVTVLSVNSIRDARIKAASVGDPNYPDPIVSWTKIPQYKIILCLNTTDRSSNLCNSSIYVSGYNGLHEYTTNALDGFKYYYWVQLKNNSGSYKDYQSGSWNNSCFLLTGTTLCPHTIKWDQPTFTAQAVVHGITPLKNACTGGVSTCVSNKTTIYPSVSVQFVDLPTNIYIDTYVYVKSELFDITANTPTGSVDITTAPTLTAPRNGETNVTVNNTPFAWTAVPGATYYALWVSTSSDFTYNGFWYKKIPSTACNSTACVANWNNIPWSTQNGNIGPFPPPPAQLAYGKTYYWSVWACSTTCPLVSLSKTSNFTTALESNLPAEPAGLKDSDTQATISPGVWGTTHKFEWTAAGASTFAVDISSDANFATGHFVNKVINVTPATGLTNYSAFGDSGWANQGTADYSLNGQLALKDGVTYYWRVYAQNASGSKYSALPNKVVNKPALNTKPAVPYYLIDSDSQKSVQPGVWGNTHKFSWIGGNTTEFNVLISSDKAFAGNFLRKTIKVTASTSSSTYSTLGDTGWVVQGSVNYVNNGALSLAETTQYYWWVFAKNSSGEVYSVIDPLDKPATSSTTGPVQPYSLTSNIGSQICGETGYKYGGGLIFNWVGGNTSSFAVDISDNPSFAGFANKVISGSQTTMTGDAIGARWVDNYNVTPLTNSGTLYLEPGKTYYWRVWVKNSVAELYDAYYSAGAPRAFTLQLCSTNLAPLPILPTVTDASPQPSFVWKPTKATYYGIGVSDSKDGLLNFTRLWRSYVVPSDCGPLGCVRNWNDGPWYTMGNIGSKPLALTPGKTYYYYIWACTPTGCPVNGLVNFSFTVKGSIDQTPATVLATVPGDNNVKFNWDPAKTNDGSIDHYRVLLKQTVRGTNFAQGDFWSKDVPVLACFSLGFCQTNLDGTWAWTKGISNVDNPANPPRPLYTGGWAWVVLACKSVTCDAYNMLVSSVATFSAPSYAAGVTATLQPEYIRPAVCINGKASTNFAWKSAGLLTGAVNPPRQILDYSIYNNNFLAGTFSSRGILDTFRINENYTAFVDLPVNTTFYWRVSTERDGYFYFSSTGSFKTIDCPVSQQYPTPQGFVGDGSWEDLARYIESLTAGIPDPKVSGVALTKVMWDTVSEEDGTLFSSGDNINLRNKGLCAVGSLGEIGVFQFLSPTWKGTAESKSGVDSGSGTTSYWLRGDGGSWNGCWKIPGRDSNTDDPSTGCLSNGVFRSNSDCKKLGGTFYDYETTFGPNIDNNAWNPYAQVRAAVTKFKAGNHCEWSGFKRAYPGHC